MNRSPYHIIYKDLIEHAETTLKRLEKHNPRLVFEGRLSPHASQKGIECQKKIVALLKRHMKDPQINLFEEFSKIK